MTQGSNAAFFDDQMSQHNFSNDHTKQHFPSIFQRQMSPSVFQRKTIHGNSNREKIRKRRLDFGQRTTGNKCLWVVYKAAMLLYNGPYYYFTPVLVWAAAFPALLFNKI